MRVVGITDGRGVRAEEQWSRMPIQWVCMWDGWINLKGPRSLPIISDRGRVKQGPKRSSTSGPHIE
jgi:hypothetical protein